jgi:hypothetical protein
VRNSSQVKTITEKGGMTLCNKTQSLLQVSHGGQCEKQITSAPYDQIIYLGETSSPKK